jgi:hypothetical protein
VAGGGGEAAVELLRSLAHFLGLPAAKGKERRMAVDVRVELGRRKRRRGGGARRSGELGRRSGRGPLGELGREVEHLPTGGNGQRWTGVRRRRRRGSGGTARRGDGEGAAARTRVRKWGLARSGCGRGAVGAGGGARASKWHGAVDSAALTRAGRGKRGDAG